MDHECNRHINITVETCESIVDMDNHSQAPLLLLRFELAVVYITLATLLSILGVFGNCFILYIVVKELKINDHFKYFMINGAIADLCVSGIADPMCIAGAIMGMQPLTRQYWLCPLIATLCLTACVCVFLNFTNLTINRWFYICHNQKYTNCYDKIRILSICVFCWIGGIVAVIPIFFGWGGHSFDIKSHQCIWDRTADRSYTLFVAIGLVTTPFVVTAFCNVAIFLRVLKVKREIGVFQVMEYSALLNSIRTVKTLIVMYFTYLVCWTPYVVILILDHNDSFSLETHLFVTLLAHAHSSTGFFIYAACNRRFKEILRKRLAIFRTNRVQPLTGNHRNDIKHLSSSGKLFPTFPPPDATVSSYQRPTKMDNKLQATSSSTRPTIKEYI